ncbi:helix-turn-helix domain-containing protein [Roseomonas sp. KE2513]|uniref:helix-turn-helix domain-containing protein n=1 Tax=Roseomonas sp. KE2513 TaxID=2479202 RepID=UPI0018DFF67D|nr:helix-turn-helix domain-containing protein [Roseomonas sp. KE2513]MBI0538862.1 helix-turn-helix domain-containing protein [Roseomonas sp. KE2513]
MVKPDMMTAEAARVGEELRDARLALGATLDEVADELRINRRYIAALEEGRPGDLPGLAYALGFIRTYATALGLDATDLARRYRDSETAGRGRTDLVFPEEAAKRSLPAGAVILLGLLILAGTYAAWWTWSGSAGRTLDAVPPLPARTEQAARDARQAAAETAPVLPSTLGQATPGSGPRPNVPAPSASQGAAPAAPGEATSRVSLRATDEAWVQVRDPRSGQTVLNRVLRPGESFAIPRDGLVLTTGKAQAVEVLLDGHATQALSGKVGLVRDVDLAPDQLRPPRAAPGARPPTR